MINIATPFDPLTIGPITLRNRFVKSGANEAMSYEGAPSKALVQHHQAISRGGVGMTTVAYGAVSKVGRTLDNQIWIRPEILPDLRTLTDAIHAEGAKASMQITHGGSFVTSLKVDGPTLSASSGINKAGLLKGNFFRRAMSETDMQTIIQEFVTAAQLCGVAGFDAVEIHMGHGYLLNQFISPLDNKRRDQYGGSPQNRVRFPAQVLSAVKAAVGDSLAVIAKMNVSDGVPSGATIEDGVITARALEAAGADLLVLSGGRNIESTWFMFGSNMNVAAMDKALSHSWLMRTMFRLATKSAPKITFHEMYFLEYSRKIRAAVKVPLGFLGGVKSLANTETALREGFDCVVIARALIHDPDLINKFKRKEVLQSGCTSCNACIAQIYNPAGTYCVLNAPNELELNLRRASA